MRSKRTLPQGGVFAQWFHLYRLHPDDVRCIIRTFHEAFPHVLLFEVDPGKDFLLLGSDEPLGLDVERIEQRLGRVSVQADLRRIRKVRPSRIDVSDPYKFLTLFRMGTAEVDRFTAGAKINTDNNAYIEYSAPLALLVGSKYKAELLRLIGSFQSDAGQYMVHYGDTPQVQAEALVRLAMAYEESSRFRQALTLARRAQAVAPTREGSALVARLEVELWKPASGEKTFLQNRLVPLEL